MGDMLSQAEIDALLNGALDSEDESSGGEPDSSVSSHESLSSEEKDTLGEIGNICMGTSATTLYTLLGQKVNITTPRVELTTWDEMSRKYSSPYVAVNVKYTHGLTGTNLLIMKEADVKIITDLMMGGDGTGNRDEDLSDLHLSAISEAMNQMVGSSATSLSSMFDKRVDISPPVSQRIHLDTDKDKVDLDTNQVIVMIAFKLTVGDLIDSEIMQILPVEFARELVGNLMNVEHNMAQGSAPKQVPKPASQQKQNPVPQVPQQEYPAMYINQQPSVQNMQPQNYQQPQMFSQQPQNQAFQQPVNVQPAHFESFEPGITDIEKKNIGLLMDVPLQITVELGRTNKKIREILEFGQGSIIELDKLAGEPVDILVNGKTIAKGEVVVIDESFGVRITDIIHPSKRL